MYTMKQYRDAVEAWRKAVDEIDQAHACLRDVDMHQFAAERSRCRISIETVMRDAFTMLVELERSLKEEDFDEA